MASISFSNGENRIVNNIFCIGRNYAKHAQELNNAVPDEPVVFLKPNSSIIHDGQDIHLPSRSSDVHHEVELVLAIGKDGSNIHEDDATSYIDGIAVGIDVTARDIQSKAKEAGKPWSIAKGFDTFAPVSSFLTPPDNIDYGNLKISLNVNKSQRQRGYTKDLLFPVPFLISYLSSIFTLQKGDLIFTGTPEGVAQINPGDELEAVLTDPHLTLSNTAVPGKRS